MVRTRLTPDAVIAAAAALADDDGLAAVTLSALARRLGVQTPSLYTHVRDHDAVLDGITALALTELAGRVSAAIAGRAGGAALEAFAAAHRAYARESPGRWQALQRRAGAAAVRSPGARELVELTGAVLRGYPVPEADHVHAIRLLGSAINGFLALERIGSFDHSQPEPEVSWDKMVAVLDATLRSWPAS
ncbi:TetR-like C-terminal domain-containing protein [Labedaea rhizosphaerae]|uniref:TetR family transcriptional regulator n=1 Tax=Labedaea rhizosphaerae TaxID=598644 RepID=A0A4R6SHB5_LABRH|nr:TetR-like C-terminal domain-containing protein [Labedaea rhizosphaerae]TDQ00239.1 TetR family transcriptional regulator [Labedaea rhizosphaerae]